MNTLTAPDALDLCNSCDFEDAHPGCPAGYCADCCPTSRKDH